MIFATDNVQPNKIARMAGSAPLDGIFEKINSFDPLSWVAKDDKIGLVRLPINENYPTTSHHTSNERLDDA